MEAISLVTAASIAAASAAPVSVGVVSFVIFANLVEVLSEIFQSELWSGRGAEIRRNQATSLVAARRCVSEAQRARHIIVLARSTLGGNSQHVAIPSSREL
ncbi:MAG TPA: hypothetical protein VMJ10_13645 [Kofleriaceae bacterium]|nr:hypothetical protein [Kofleriaceae bacterium]